MLPEPKKKKRETRQTGNGYTRTHIHFPLGYMITSNKRNWYEHLPRKEEKKTLWLLFVWLLFFSRRKSQKNLDVLILWCSLMGKSNRENKTFLFLSSLYCQMNDITSKTRICPFPLFFFFKKKANCQFFSRPASILLIWCGSCERRKKSCRKKDMLGPRAISVHTGNPVGKDKTFCECHKLLW